LTYGIGFTYSLKSKPICEVVPLQLPRSNYQARDLNPSLSPQTIPEYCRGRIITADLFLARRQAMARYRSELDDERERELYSREGRLRREGLGSYDEP